MRKGTSEEGTELCMDGARGRGEGGSDRKERGSNGERYMSKVEEQYGRTVGGREIGREGNFKGGTLEDTGRYTIYSAQNYPQRGPCP